MLCLRQRWDVASTGGGVAVNGFGYGTQNTVIYRSLGTSTGAISLEMAQSSGGPFGTIPGTSTIVSSGGANVITFDGPLLWVRPYSSNVAGAGGIRVELLSNDGV